MKNVNDLYYIQQVKSGNTRAFANIVYKYQNMVLTVVMKIVDNKEDAEDITQEIFIKVFKSLEQFKEEAEFSTWLYRIAYNTTLSELRKRKLFFTSIEDSLLDVNESVIEDFDFKIEEKLEHLDKALKLLAPDETFLITLYYLDGQSIDKISKVSNISVSNVKIKLFRIRKKLAAEIKKLMENESK